MMWARLTGSDSNGRFLSEPFVLSFDHSLLIYFVMELAQWHAPSRPTDGTSVATPMPDYPAMR
jgi:hypothetical protein